MFAPWRSQNHVRKTWVSDYWKITLLYVYNDLGQILECGFNLASKNFTFLLERACVARYRTECANMPQ